MERIDPKPELISALAAQARRMRPSELVGWRLSGTPEQRAAADAETLRRETERSNVESMTGVVEPL